MTFLEAQQELCKRLNVSYTDVSGGLNGLFTLDDIKGFIQEAHKLVWDLKDWDHTEGSKTFTFSSSDITNGYIDYPTDYVTGSVFLLLVDGVEYYKTSFRDLKMYLAQNSSGDFKYIAERQTYVFFNTNAISAGQTGDLFGKLRANVLSDDTDLMQFSQESDNRELSGNDAVVQIAYSNALASDKKKDKTGAEREGKEALGKLGALYEQFAGNRVTEKPSRPQFDVPDFYGSGYADGNPIGKFNQ